MSFDSLRRIGKGRQAIGVIYETGVKGVVFMDETFKGVTLHVINDKTGEVIFNEPYNEVAYMRDRHVIERGEQRYQIVRQQVTLDHYYVWVTA